MIILTLRSDNPQAEIGLFNDTQKIDYYEWEAHRQLSATIHTKIKNLLDKNGKDWQDIEAIVCYQGPGSFTGLRIGLTVVNTLATELKVPIVGETRDDWQRNGIANILDGKGRQIVLPEYGAPVHITQPKK